MNYLVDTHVRLWSFIEPEKLSQRVRELLLDEENAIYYGQFSLWEISIKYCLKKIELIKKTPEQFYEELESSFYLCRKITNQELVSFHKLPFEHKDPFDRALIWQSIQNDYVFISSDSKLDQYKKHGLKFIAL